MCAYRFTHLRRWSFSSPNTLNVIVFFSAVLSQNPSSLVFYYVRQFLHRNFPWLIYLCRFISTHLIFAVLFLLFIHFQLHFDNDREARREREVRLTGSKLDLNFCGAPRATATQLSSSHRTIDSHGNAVSALSSPQSSSSNNNVSPTHDESEKFSPMTPNGKCICAQCTLVNQRMCCFHIICVCTDQVLLVNVLKQCYHFNRCKLSSTCEWTCGSRTLLSNKWKITDTPIVMGPNGFWY